MPGKEFGASQGPGTDLLRRHAPRPPLVQWVQCLLATEVALSEIQSVQLSTVAGVHNVLRRMVLTRRHTDWGCIANWPVRAAYRDSI
jgi:hypothetical protein